MPAHRCSYLGLQVGHGLVKGLWRRPLVVTQNGNGPVGSVVGEQLLGHRLQLCGRASGE